MSVPVIGLTTRHGKNENGYPAVYLLRAYVAALVEAGGVPILIPSDLNETGWRALYGRLDGLLFTGGGDIAIERFHGEPHPTVDAGDPERDEIELSLLKMALEGGKPFLGICRGIQMINVGLGGTLYTHILDQMPGAVRHDYHPEYPRDYRAHAVKIEPGTRLAQILGETALDVNSMHHQGLKDVPAAARPVAFSSDGLVEGIEVQDHPFGLGVQWHPEWLTDSQPARRLFHAFVEAADGGKRT